MTQLVGKPQVDITSPSLNLDVSNVRTYTGAIAAVLALSQSGLSKGKDITVIVPAGKATGKITFPSSWNVKPADGNFVMDDDFDSALDSRIDLSTADHQGTVIVAGVFWQLSGPDVTAPLLLSLVGNVGSDEIVATFDEPVFFPDTTDLTLLPWTSGTAKTLTGTIAGSGTDTITLTTSAVLASGDAFSLTYGASNTITDLANNALASGVTAFAFDAAMPQAANLLIHSSAPRQATITSNVIVDYSGNGNDGTETGIIMSDGATQFDFQNSTSARINHTINAPTGDYTAIFRGRHASGSVWSGNLTAWSSASTQFINYFSALVVKAGHGGATTDGSHSISGWVTGVDHEVAFSYNSTTNTLRVFVDDMSTPVDSISMANDPGTVQLLFGTFGTINGWRNKISGLAIWDVELVSQAERESAFSGLL